MPSRDFPRLLGLLLGALLLAGTVPAGADDTLVIGKVSDDPRKHYRRLKPMVDYAVERMGDLGITRGEVRMARDNEQMVRYLREGRVDWVTETVFSSLLYRDRAGSEILLRKWKKGVPDYRTVFITRKDSDIHALADLAGHRLALEDPGSSTAFFLPLALLLDAGIEPVALEGTRAEIPAGKAGYVFAAEEINIAAWVYKGLADAGAYNDLDWENPDHTPRAFRRDLRIFHSSEPLPRALESVRGDLDPAVRERLVDILLAAHEDPAGRKALHAYQETARFDRIDAESRARIREVEGLLRRLKDREGEPR